MGSPRTGPAGIGASRPRFRSPYECGCVEQSAPGSHARPISNSAALKAFPGRVTTVATAGARLMADQHAVRAERVPARAVLRGQDHPAALRAGHEITEGSRHDPKPSAETPTGTEDVIYVLRSRAIPRSGDRHRVDWLPLCRGSHVIFSVCTRTTPPVEQSRSASGTSPRGHN
jgi:hypothetical protein